MGNTNSNTSSSSKNEQPIAPSLTDSRVKPRYSLEENFIYLLSLSNENYGDIKIMRIKGESDQNLYALKVFRMNDAKSMHQIYHQAIFRKDLTLDTIVKIRDVRFDEANLYCSDHFKVLVLFEYFEMTLKDEIQRRKSKKLYFSDKDILNLIDCVLSALILFDQKSIDHEDVCPSTIYLTPNQIYKLNDIQFLTEGLNAYKKFFMGAKEPNECYLSQELLNNLKHRCLVPENYIKQKSDVFSLGMTVLEAATLKSMKDCYDFDEFKLKTENISSYIEELRTNFCPSLCQLISCMVEIDENKRPDYQDLYTFLAPVLDSIKANENNGGEFLEIQPEILEIREEKKVKASPLASPPIIDINENNILDGKILKVLQISEEMQKKYTKDLENSRHAINDDDFKDLIAKREDFLSRSNFIKENLYKERNTKMTSEDENFFDSNKLYEVYLEEYEKLKASSQE